MKVIENANELYTNYVNSHMSKYVTSYEIKDNDLIVVKSNIGRYRVVKNTKKNLKKLDDVIEKNKKEIANKIENYADSTKERLMVIIMNILLIMLSGVLTITTFAIGNYVLVLFALITFSMCILTTSVITLDYYLTIKEIQNLQNITGYKKYKYSIFDRFKKKVS